MVACPKCRQKLKLAAAKANAKSGASPKPAAGATGPRSGDGTSPNAAAASFDPLAGFAETSSTPAVPDGGGPTDDNPFGGLDLPPVDIPAAPVFRTAPAAASPPANPVAGPGSPPATPSMNAASARPGGGFAAAQMAAASHRNRLLDAIRRQIDAPLPARKPSVAYRLMMSLTAAAMLMMPLAYVALVAGVVWMWGHYTLGVFPSLAFGSGVRGGRIMAIWILLCTAPIIAGVVVVLFMIKPLFFTLVGFGEPRRRRLTREGEPVLFELIDRICRVTGAPVPARVEVDADMNASASRGGGLKALLGGEMVLRIGVPLVAGLDARQFAGVLAHEFGHFAQGGGMRAQIVVAWVIHWFQRVVYLRDGLDEALDEAIDDSESAFGLVFLFAKACVTIVRGILHGFMIAAHAIGSGLSRQMEYDADRYEAMLVGGDVFAETGREFHRMAVACDGAAGAVGRLLNRGKLIDNYPRIIEVYRSRMTDNELAAVDVSIAAQKTGAFDSHPATRSRIEAVGRLGCDGVFTEPGPAAALFVHYQALCRNVTADFYRNALDRMIDPNELEPVERHLAAVIEPSGDPPRKPKATYAGWR